MKRIAIHSVPRSGSSWLGEIFNSNELTIYKYQPLFSYAFKNRLTPNSTKIEIINFFNELKYFNDDFLDQKKEREKELSPIFIKNEKLRDTIVYKEVRYHHILKNLLEKDNEIKIIGLVRNPLSVIYSWLMAPKEFKKNQGWKEMDEWRFASKKNLNKPEEFNGFEKWKEVAYLFEDLNQLYPNRFYLLRYDELINNSVKVVTDMFDFCGMNFLEQTDDFLTFSSNTDRSDEAYSVFRNEQKDDKWKSNLNPLIINEIHKDLKGSALEKYLG